MIATAGELGNDGPTVGFGIDSVMAGADEQAVEDGASKTMP